MVNEWTRDDLPTISAIAPIAADPKSYVYFAVSIALDAVVKHLNTHHPKPADPVEDKARELLEVAQGDGPFIVWEALMDPERNMYRRMAAHVLGQEDRHVDQ